MTDKDKEIKHERTIAAIQSLAGQFLNEQSNRSSMITVTKCSLSPDGKRSTIYISVYPVEKEEAALDFSKRKRGELRDFIKDNLRMRTIPFFEIEIDEGEKNRQRIDELLNQ